MTKKFENRLDKSNIKFNTLNPVWDNERGTALNVFEMIELLNKQDQKIKILENEEIKIMTENERFIVQERCVVDTNDNETFEFSFKVDAEIICEELNKIEKENEQLNFRNSNLMKEVAEYSRKAKELEKENEQLKKILGFLPNDNATDILNVLNYQENQRWKFQKENKQLKKEVSDLKQALIRCAFE